MNITFHGAARTVTGSQHLVNINGHNLLLDCGLYQGRRRESQHGHVGCAECQREFGSVIELFHGVFLPALLCLSTDLSTDGDRDGPMLPSGYFY